MNNMQNFYIPIAILIAVVLITGSLFYSGTVGFAGDGVSGGVDQIDSGNHQVTPEPERALVSPQRNENRHVYGNPDAPVTIVEFSDYECPFCSRVHPTFERLVAEMDGQVNWEFRHLPLPMHPNARDAAIAAECVAELAGNDAFWKFSEYLFANQRTLGSAVYESGASALGVSFSAFSSCIERDDIAERILTDERIAAVLGGSGTPFNVIVYEDGTTRSVPGALPYTQFKSLVAR